ncbi:hypothetical protein KF946_11790 [Idiomarina loihiensis]|uniref:hypothetical protein n=1 Tax=Idiomarina loihiensis TaxID=135577 RepID=UPI00129CE00E|nr:hypothetical protein [Idiomarina loihiensis]MRJ44277.1 hypothetical protein [Idiomarina loihiensis]UTW32681.1 hypothetical protein KF946_11790 [Idiomarina loihiensis]
MNRKHLTHILTALFLLQASIFPTYSYAVEMDERMVVTGYWLPRTFYIDLYFGGNYRPEVVRVHNSPLGGGNNSGSPYSLTKEEEEEFFENTYDKTPWTKDQEDHFLAELETFIKAYEKLVENADLANDMESKLTTSIGKAVRLYDALKNSDEISNHMVNSEYAELVAAVAEITIGSTAVALGAAAVVVVGGLPGIVTGAFIAAGGVIAGDDAKEYLANRLTGFSFSQWVRNVGRRFDAIAWEANSFEFVKYVCSYYPELKWDLVDGCENAVPVPPIFIDLDGDGFKFLSASESKISFDVNFDGKANLLPWTEPSDPVLFADLNRNGVMDHVREFMFANYSILKNATDLDGLKMFDINSDGYLNRDDPSYDIFFLWSDYNRDGISTQDEVVSISEKDIYFHLKEKKLNNNLGVASQEESFTVHFYFNDKKKREAGSFKLFTIK